MNKLRIRWVIILGTFSMLGIAIAQIYWVNRALNISEQELDQGLQVALLSVAEDMAALNDHRLASTNPVSQLSRNYYVVAINDKIDANILEHYLSQEFRERDLLMDYEYGIYDCSSDQMVYGNYVGKEDPKQLNKTLPKWEDNIYYFGVRFPQRRSYVLRELKFWMFSTVLVLIVLVVFAYALFIILKQRRLSEVQKDFVNTMTHEFKTPLSTIAISANVLAESDHLKKDERLQKYVNIVQEENDRLQKQVSKLLQMTDLEKDRIELKIEEVNLHDIMQQVASHLELRAKEEGGHISLSLKAQNPMVFADKLHLTNILFNLVDNAIKYSPKGPDVLLESYEENGLNFRVSDKGNGMENEEMKKIFQKFYRIHTGDVHDVKGFGLGLSYVMKMVKEHGWKIEVSSEIGIGSSFTIKTQNHG